MGKWIDVGYNMWWENFILVFKWVNLDIFIYFVVIL